MWRLAARRIAISLRQQACSCPDASLSFLPAHTASGRRFATAPGSAVKEVTTDAEYSTALSSAKGLTVTDYTATWCGPCRFIAPVYEQLARDHPSVQFLKVDIDAPSLEATVRAAGVSAVPTFTFHVNGKPVGDVIRGADAEALRAAIRRHCAQDAST